MPLYVVSSTKGTNYVLCAMYSVLLAPWETAMVSTKNGPEATRLNKIGKTVTFSEWTDAKDGLNSGWILMRRSGESTRLPPLREVIGS